MSIISISTLFRTPISNQHQQLSSLLPQGQHQDVSHRIVFDVAGENSGVMLMSETRKKGVSNS